MLICRNSLVWHMHLEVILSAYVDHKVYGSEYSSAVCNPEKQSSIEIKTA